MTFETLVRTFLQPDDRGPWIDGVRFLYNGKNEWPSEHCDLSGTHYRDYYHYLGLNRPKIRHSSFTTGAEILGYQVGTYADDNDEAAITARFGKTFRTESLGHSGGPIYKTADGRAYLAFSWSDSGLETVLVTRNLPSYCYPPEGVRLHPIRLRTGDIVARRGIHLGDSTRRLRTRLGRPDIKRKNGSGTSWLYVSEWSEDGKGNRSPVKTLRFDLQHGVVIEMCAEMEEP